MPILVILSVVVQAACVIHVLKTGRDRYWIWILIFAPMLGAVAYLIVEVLPGMRANLTARRAARKIVNVVDPGRSVRQLSRDLEISDNVENTIKLADECIESGMYDKAVELYEHARSGVFADDPAVLLGAARAYYHVNDFARTRDTLDHLIEAQPDFKSADGHLLYAMALDGLRDDDKALEEFETLVQYYPGAEAGYRYGVLLKRLGRSQEARDAFDQVLRTAKLSPRHYRKLHKQWISAARKELNAL